MPGVAARRVTQSSVLICSGVKEAINELIKAALCGYRPGIFSPLITFRRADKQNTSSIFVGLGALAQSESVVFYLPTAGQKLPNKTASQTSHPSFHHILCQLAALSMAASSPCTPTHARAILPILNAGAQVVVWNESKACERLT